MGIHSEFFDCDFPDKTEYMEALQKELAKLGKASAGSLINQLLENFKKESTDLTWKFGKKEYDHVPENVLMVKGYSAASNKLLDEIYRIKVGFVARTFDYERRRWLWFCETGDGCFSLLDKDDIKDLWAECTMEPSLFNDARRFLLETEIKELEGIQYYGYDWEEHYWRLPPEYVATNATGWGDDFYRDFKHCDIAVAWKNAMKYKALFEETVRGIGIFAYINVGWAFASLFKDHFLEKIDYFPFLLCWGPKGTHKSKPLEKLLNLPRVNIIYNTADITSEAVFTQSMSSGMYPLLVDELAQVNDTIQDVLKVSSTGLAGRKRLKNNAKKRDNPPQIRSIAGTCNNLEDWMRKPEIMDRGIYNHYTQRASNAEQWDAIRDEYNKTEGNVLSFIVHCFEGRYDRTNLKRAFEEATKNQKKQRENFAKSNPELCNGDNKVIEDLGPLTLLEADVGEMIDIPSPDLETIFLSAKNAVNQNYLEGEKDRGPKKCLIVLFGLRLARDLLGIDVTPEIEREICQCIRVSQNDVLIEKITHLWTCLATYANNYEQLVTTQKLIEELEFAKAHPGEFDDLGKIENRLIQAQRYSKQLQEKPLCKVVRRKDSKDWFAVTTEVVDALLKEGIPVKSLAELEQITDICGITCEGSGYSKNGKEYRQLVNLMGSNHRCIYILRESNVALMAKEELPPNEVIKNAVRLGGKVYPTCEPEEPQEVEEAPKVPAKEEKFDIDHLMTGHSRSNVSKIGKVLEILRDMEEENGNKPVELDALKDRVALEGEMKEEDIDDALKTLKKEGDIIYPKKGMVKSVKH